MENQDLSTKEVLPYFYPTLSVTDASDICMGHYKLGKKKLTDYLSTRNDAFKSLIEMVEFNSGEDIKEIMKKYPMSKEQKEILREYFIKLKNTEGLINRKELDDLLYGRFVDLNKIIISKITSNEWQVNLLIEKMSELDGTAQTPNPDKILSCESDKLTLDYDQQEQASNPVILQQNISIKSDELEFDHNQIETSHTSNQDKIISEKSNELRLDHDQNTYLTETAQTSNQGIIQQVFSIKSDQFVLENNQIEMSPSSNQSSFDSTEITLKREQVFDVDDINITKKKQKIAVNNASANHLKLTSKYKQPKKSGTKKFKNFKLSGQFDVINNELYCIKTSSVYENPDQIKLDKSDKIKMLFYMQLSDFNKCKFVRIGKSNEEIAEYYDETQFDITTDSLIEELNEFVESVRSLTKDQFITEYKKFTKV